MSVHLRILWRFSRFSKECARVEIELVILPSGHIRLDEGSFDPEQGASGRNAVALRRAFDQGQAPGLVALASIKAEALPESAAYWRDFAVRFLTELCHTPPDSDDDIPTLAALSPTDCAQLILCVPPMRGAEYLNDSVLDDAWRDLNSWMRAEIASTEGGLPEFLRRRAPLWHQIGRVCFHLAENKRDPENPFAFMATYSRGISSGSRVQYQPLSQALKEYAGDRNKKALIHLLSPVHEASQKSAVIKDLVESGNIYHPLAWTPAQAYRFLKEVPLLEESGVLVRLPDWWKKRPRPRVGMSVGNSRRGRFGIDEMLDFQIQATLGDEDLTEDELRRLMTADEGLVFLKGQWVEVDPERLSEALEHWKQVERVSEGGLSFIQGMRLLAGAPANLSADGDLTDAGREWSFVRAGDWLGSLLAKLRDPENLENASPGRAFRATLRPYQEIGVNWLSFLSSLGLGACLADDMGLGKTIQLLALLLKKKSAGRTKPSLLVLPTSLLANWKSEIQKFAPSLRVRFVHPSEGTTVELDPLGQWPKRTDLVLTTYGMVLRLTWLAEVSWELVVLDEAQAIKNPAARQTQAVKRLPAEARIALTGTPVENRLSDLWSLFDFLLPGLLGSRTKFKRFVKDLDGRESDRYAPLRGLVQPYILRRMKTDRRIISDLPDKTEVSAWCGLSKRQATIYAKLVKELAESLEEREGIQRRGLVLAYLMRFKQICNHPSQLLDDGAFAPGDSGKFARLGEVCEEIASRQEKALVFTQFREMTDPLAHYLSEIFGRQGLVLHGGTSVKNRKRMIDEFQRETGPPFFVLSLKAGGVGLNLTAASHVIHFDRWWNPAVENQATDRAFRIGQKKNVLVHKFICRGTVEEKIDKLIEEKKQLASDILEGGAEKMLTEMSDDELIRLVSLDVDRAQV